MKPYLIGRAFSVRQIAMGNKKPIIVIFIISLIIIILNKGEKNLIKHKMIALDHIHIPRAQTISINQQENDKLHLIATLMLHSQSNVPNVGMETWKYKHLK